MLRYLVFFFLKRTSELYKHQAQGSLALHLPLLSAGPHSSSSEAAGIPSPVCLSETSCASASRLALSYPLPWFFLPHGKGRMLRMLFCAFL